MNKVKLPLLVGLFYLVFRIKIIYLVGYGNMTIPEEL